MGEVACTNFAMVVAFFLGSSMHKCCDAGPSWEVACTSFAMVVAFFLGSMHKCSDGGPSFLGSSIHKCCDGGPSYREVACTNSRRASNRNSLSQMRTMSKDPPLLFL